MRARVRAGHLPASAILSPASCISPMQVQQVQQRQLNSLRHREVYLSHLSGLHVAFVSLSRALKPRRTWSAMDGGNGEHLLLSCAHVLRPSVSSTRVPPASQEASSSSTAIADCRALCTALHSNSWRLPGCMMPGHLEGRVVCSTPRADRACLRAHLPSSTRCCPAVDMFGTEACCVGGTAVGALVSHCLRVLLSYLCCSTNS